MPTLASRTLTRAVVGTSVLGVAKLVAAILTGSQAVAASAADSLTDAVMSAANRWMVNTAHRPADSGHPFGHGKAEALAALLQALILSGVVAGISWRAIHSLRTGASAPAALPAILVMVGSMGASLLLARSLLRAAVATGSLVLRTDALHYRMDLWSGAAVLVGLGVSALTGSGIADGLACLAVCVLMTRDIVGIAVDAVGELMDRTLAPAEIAVIERVLDTFTGRIDGWHALRTRRSGPHRFVQVHIELPGDTRLSAAHAVADAVEAALRDAIPGADAIVHVDETRDG